MKSLIGFELSCPADLSLTQIGTLTIAYPVEGAGITVLQNGKPVGRGTVAGGLAEIIIVAEVDPLLPLQVSACLDNDICVPIYGYSVYLPLILRQIHSAQCAESTASKLKRVKPPRPRIPAQPRGARYCSAHFCLRFQGHHTIRLDEPPQRRVVPARVVKVQA